MYTWFKLLLGWREFADGRGGFCSILRKAPRIELLVCNKKKSRNSKTLTITPQQVEPKCSDMLKILECKAKSCDISKISKEWVQTSLPITADLHCSLFMVLLAVFDNLPNCRFLSFCTSPYCNPWTSLCIIQATRKVTWLSTWLFTLVWILL